ncbi:hypothetical protein [Acetobacter aceti]|uniref:Uncharacterized protein n=1 Tax=Acetobacter aceti TaxID=435 RepID=A0A6S6PLB5_ACEAC|nr:hypothetical protein [Acetobacter aceti]BCI68133.1 hypothetical protein AAJCM20276_27570 [Acetobacter aceti]
MREPTPEMIEAAIRGAWDHTVQFDSGISWEEWREISPDAAGEFSKGIEAGLKAALAAMKEDGQ